MKRNHNDKLIELAFGDLRGSEAEALRREIEQNPDASEELIKFEALKADLRRLNDIPAPQISAERLRDRILGEGLRPKPAGFGWSWFAAPVAAGALALMFMKMNSTPGANPTIVGVSKPNETVAINRPAPRMSEPLGNVKPNIQPDLAVTKEADPAPISVPHMRLASHSSRHSGRRGEIISGNTIPYGPESPKPLVASTGSTGADSVASRNSGHEALAMMDAAPADQNSVVLIQPEQDTETGAQKATEVSPSNVTIGG